MHIYERTGSGIEPRHYVDMTTRQGQRPATLRDFKKWRKEGKDVYPSVTTIMSVLDKPALVGWKINQHLEVAHKYSDSLTGMTESQFFAEVKRLAEMHMDAAPTAGTNVHQILEDWFNGTSYAPGTYEYELCEKVWSSISFNTNHVIPKGMAEQMIASPLGYAGCVDLVLDGWIIDYKTKLEASKFKPGKMVYDEHVIQLAAYRKEINPSARCANIFICIETGEVDFHEHPEDELQRGWKIFDYALQIWKLKNDR